MSDELNPSQPGAQPTPLATAIADQIPQPPKEFAYTDKHTPDNTPLKRHTEPLSESLGQVEDTDQNRQQGFTTVFIGNSKADFERAQELVGTYVAVTSIRNAGKNSSISKSMLNSAEAEWKRLCDEKYPGVEYAVMEERAGDLYRYLQNTSDGIMVRTKVMHERGSNVFHVSDKVVMGDITGLIPSASTRAGSLSEEMERGAARGNNSPYQYSVHCRNSFLKFQFLRGNKSEGALLINEINATIRGYVRTVGGNSLTLSLLAGYRALWNWLCPQIVYSTVDGIADFKDLAKSILVSDMPAIMSAVLCAFEDDEMYMDMRCFNPACDWSSFERINPALLLRQRDVAHTDEELALLGNIFNGTERYNAKQLSEFVANAKYGVEDNYLYNENQTIRLTCGPVSLAEAFLALDYVVSKVDPQIASARTTITNSDDLEAQIAIILKNLGGGEMLHWVTEFAFMPTPGSNEPPRIVRRRDSDQFEFNKGLHSVLAKDKYLDAQLIRFVYTTVPYMSKTFIGIRNCACPKCGKGSEEFNGVAKNLGYTPIDVFMTFFTHIQFVLVREAEAKQRVELEVLS